VELLRSETAVWFRRLVETSPVKKSCLETRMSQNLFVGLSGVRAELYIYVKRFMYYFERAFPYKTVYIKDRKKTKWISQRIKVSSQKMRLLRSYTSRCE
jgi:hypothetical protein